MKQDFIPATMARPIGDGVFFRPIRSWHSGTYAGERLTKIPGTTDLSGCLGHHDRPLTVTHRVYWNETAPEKIVSSFLSYPDGMGACDVYFWEAYPSPEGDIERWTGEDAEQIMEDTVRSWLKGASK